MEVERVQRGTNEGAQGIKDQDNYHSQNHEFVHRRNGACSHPLDKGREQQWPILRRGGHRVNRRHCRRRQLLKIYIFREGELAARPHHHVSSAVTSFCYPPSI